MENVIQVRPGFQSRNEGTVSAEMGDAELEGGRETEGGREGGREGEREGGVGRAGRGSERQRETGREREGGRPGERGREGGRERGREGGRERDGGRGGADVDTTRAPTGLNLGPCQRLG